MGTTHPVTPPALARAIDPALRRSARANGLAGLALTLVLGLGLGQVADPALGAAFILKALAAYGLVLLILWWFLPLHWPRTRLGPANQVTLGRGVLTALVIALGVEAAGIEAGEGMGTGAVLAWTALTLALLGTLLDGVDGHLARRLGWASPLGARFDMEVDALLIAGLALLIWTLDRAGPWVLAAGALRYLFVAAGAFWPWLRRPLPPSKRRQTVCVVQILTLTLALVPVLPPVWASWVAAIGLVLLLWSFGLDIAWLDSRDSRNRGRDQELPGERAGQPEGLGFWGILGLLAALALLNVALSFQARWPGLGVEWRWEVSPEFALLVLALGLATALRGRPRYRPPGRQQALPQALSTPALISLLAGLLTLLVLGRYFAVMAPALYGRPVNLVADARFLPDVLPMILTSAPWQWLVGLPLAVLAGLGLVFAALRWALMRLRRAFDFPGPRRILILAAGTACVAYLAGMISPRLGWQGVFARPLTLDLAAQIRLAAPLLTAKLSTVVAEDLAGAMEDQAVASAGQAMVTQEQARAWAGQAMATEEQAKASTAGPVPLATAPDRVQGVPTTIPSAGEAQAGGGALARVRGAQIIVLFAEAYGAVTLDRPGLVAALAPAREELASALAATGRTAVSARVRSPTFAGVSKLAHASFLTGVEVRDYDAYERLLDEKRETLVHRFARAGYRTLAVMPGLKYEGWPEATFYGFDAVLDARALDYRGPDFGWWRIPDQFTQARLDAMEFAPGAGTGPSNSIFTVTSISTSIGTGTGTGTDTNIGTGPSTGASASAGSNPPRLVVLGNISTHAPFHPPPPYQPDWARLLTAEPFGPVPPGDPEGETQVREALLADPAGAYARTFDYFLRVLAGWLRLRADLDLVLLIIGDHQPLAAVSGEGANWEVPVHLITARPDLREAFLAAGFVPGLDPGPRVLGGMADLSHLVLRAFGR